MGSEQQELKENLLGQMNYTLYETIIAVCSQVAIRNRVATIFTDSLIILLMGIVPVNITNILDTQYARFISIMQVCEIPIIIYLWGPSVMRK